MMQDSGLCMTYFHSKAFSIFDMVASSHFCKTLCQLHMFAIIIIMVMVINYVKQSCYMSDLLMAMICCVISTLTMITGVQQPTILQSVRSAGSGQISFSPVQQAQIISNPIRFATGPNFINNTGQIIGTNQTLVNLGQFQVCSACSQLLYLKDLVRQNMK